MKAATCYSEKSFFKNLPQQQQLSSSSYQRIQPLVTFLNNTCIRSDFSAQPLSKLSNFFLCRKRCTTTIKPYSLLMILQSLQFILFCFRKMTLYQIVVRTSRKLFLLMMMYFSWLTWKLSRNFYFSLKVIKGKKQKSKFSKNNKHCTSKQKKSNNWNKKLHLSTITVHHKRWNSIHCSGLPVITQLFNRSNCFVHSSVL